MNDIETDPNWLDYDMELNPELSKEEIIDIMKESERISALLITVGSGGCTFYEDCNPITNVVGNFCYDSLVDNGEVYRNKLLKYELRAGTPIWTYLGFTKCVK